MSEAERTNEQPVKPRAEISISTKGVVTWSVKAYGDDNPAQALSAVSNAQAMHAAMIAKYGKPGGEASPS
jgi:hypothetical protein